MSFIINNLEALQSQYRSMDLMLCFVRSGTRFEKNNVDYITPTSLESSILEFQDNLYKKFTQLEREEISKFIPTLSSEQSNELEQIYNKINNERNDNIEREKLILVFNSRLEEYNGNILDILHQYLNDPNNESNSFKNLCRELHDTFKTNDTNDTITKDRIELIVNCASYNDLKNFLKCFTQ